MCQIIYMILQAGKTQPRQLCMSVTIPRHHQNLIKMVIVVITLDRHSVQQPAHSCAARAPSLCDKLELHHTLVQQSHV